MTFDLIKQSKPEIKRKKLGKGIFEKAPGAIGAGKIEFDEDESA